METLDINYTAFGLGIKGGTRIVIEVANRLAAKGHNVTFTILGISEELKQSNRLSPDIKINKVVPNYKRLAWHGFFRLGKSQLKLDFDIEKLTKSMPDCDINVATNCFSVFSVYRSMRGVPFHDMAHYEPLMVNTPYLKKYCEEIYYLPINRIANSIWLSRIMKEKYSNKVPVINPAIDHNIFYPKKPKEKDKLRVVCYSGRNVEWKGFKDALDAMQIVFEKRDDVEWLVYGSEKPKQWNSLAPYKFIKFPSDEELATLYSSADLVISPSWYESFPLPPLEAMACGTPVVTTKYGTEDYAFNKKNSLVVMPKNPKAMANAIITLLNNKNLRRKLKKEALKTAKKYTWNKTTKNMEKAFKSRL